jgi:hypothetical protein
VGARTRGRKNQGEEKNDMKANDKQPAARRARTMVPAICAMAALVGAAGFGAGCGGGSGNTTQAPGGGTGGQFTRAVSGKATVKHITLEGGFYGLITDSGERLLPLQMSSEFRQDGLRVRYDGAADDNAVSIYQWGTLTKLTSIEKLPAGE